jgi:Flp pilus assembly protein TadG
MNRRARAESGQDLVEYALILPFFLLLIVSTVEFGFLFFQYTAVVNAAREGARAGIPMSSDVCGDACIRDKAAAAAFAMLPSNFAEDNLTVLPTLQTNGSVYYVRVSVEYRTGFITPGLIEVIEAAGGSGQVTLEATATMQREY